MYDVVVIGGGPAGMAAALKAREFVDRVAIVERNDYLGGILPQCIHNGFGTQYLKKDLTGPEFAHFMEERVRGADVDLILGAHVDAVKREDGFSITLQDRVLRSKSVVFATGCKEKTRFMMNIPGDRVSGVYTAGTAQALMDIYGYLPGKRVVIVGSGDIGLIVARRLAMEGAEVVGVYEIQPYPGGLPRNIVQCLEDYNIPLYLNSTVLEIRGRGRVEGVIIGHMKDGMVEDREYVECDTVILATGLIPNSKLLVNMGAEIDPGTGGPVVNEFYETTVPGAFAAGNLLVVNDLVDHAVVQGEIAGKNAALRSRGELPERKFYRVQTSRGVKFVVPQMLSGEEEVSLMMRVDTPMEKARIRVGSTERTLMYLKPSNMVFFKFPPQELRGDVLAEVLE